MMDFTFEKPAWELALDTMRRGSSMPANRFLALMEPETEEAVEDALQIMEQRDILLDIGDLPDVAGSGEMALRLRREKQLVAEGNLPGGLEENDPLRLYLEEVASIPVCGDVQILAQESRQGSESARMRLIDLMLSRVIGKAFALAGRGVLLMDLIQEGSLGLWQAVLHYEGGDFESFCDRYISHYLHRAITLQARADGVGQKMRQALEDYRAMDMQLLTALGRNPTMEEIAQEMHITLQEAEVVAQTLDAARTVSRAKEANAPKEETAEDQMAVEDTAYFQSRQRIMELLSSLDAQEVKIINLRYGLEGSLPMSAQEVGKKLGMTAQEVVDREAAALAKLRNQ